MIGPITLQCHLTEQQKLHPAASGQFTALLCDRAQDLLDARSLLVGESRRTYGVHHLGRVRIPDGRDTRERELLAELAELRGAPAGRGAIVETTLTRPDPR